MVVPAAVRSKSFRIAANVLVFQVRSGGHSSAFTGNDHSPGCGRPSSQGIFVYCVKPIYRETRSDNKVFA